MESWASVFFTFVLGMAVLLGANAWAQRQDRDWPKGQMG